MLKNVQAIKAQTLRAQGSNEKAKIAPRPTPRGISQGPNLVASSAPLLIYQVFRRFSTGPAIFKASILGVAHR